MIDCTASDLLKDDYMMLKTMVVCTNTAEAEELNAFLLSMTKKTLLIHEKMKPIDMQSITATFR
jgi:superfamily II DNA/RNA helicase